MWAYLETSIHSINYYNNWFNHPNLFLDGVTNREDVSLSFIHTSQLVALKEEDSPVIGILCKQGTHTHSSLLMLQNRKLSNYKTVKLKIVVT